MKNKKFLLLISVIILSLSACADNPALKEGFKNTGNSIDRLIHGVFYAQIDQTTIYQVNAATTNVIDSNDSYYISQNVIHKNSSTITGTTKNTKEVFNIEMKQSGNTVNIYIKIGTFGDKSASVDLLSKIRSNLGI